MGAARWVWCGVCGVGVPNGLHTYSFELAAAPAWPRCTKKEGLLETLNDMLKKLERIQKQLDDYLEVPSPLLFSQRLLLCQSTAPVRSCVFPWVSLVVVFFICEVNWRV